jgi:hypothetical protein
VTDGDAECQILDVEEPPTGPRNVVAVFRRIELVLGLHAQQRAGRVEYGGRNLPAAFGHVLDTDDDRDSMFSGISGDRLECACFVGGVEWRHLEVETTQARQVSLGKTDDRRPRVRRIRHQQTDSL